MGIQKQNVPTRFDEETLGLIDWDRAQHKMTRSQYVRESMIKWLRLRMAGTVQLLDAFAQQEQNNLCAPREQREQGSQVEFPALASELAGPKPPMRISAPQAGARRRNIHGVNRRSYLGAGVLWANESLSFPGITGNPWGKVRPFKSNTYNGLRVA